MRTPLQRIRIGAVILSVIVLVSIIGYRILGKDYDWLDAIWMVVITISSVGYSETSSQGPAIQIFSIAVIMFGMLATAYTIGGFIQMMTAGEIQRSLGLHRMTRDIEHLANHIIICGYGRVGQFLAEALEAQGEQFVVMDNETDKVEEARAKGYLCLLGDASEEELLIEAGLMRAKTVVSSLPNDAANVFITLTSRELCPKIQIIARAEHPSTQKKLRQAGANRIVMPTIIGARQMVRMVTRPSTADLIELLYERTYLDVELDEIKIASGSKLVGMTVRETEVHRKHGLLVVAVKQADEHMIFNPEAEYSFEADDVIILMGNDVDIKRFRNQFGV